MVTVIAPFIWISSYLYMLFLTWISIRNFFCSWILSLLIFFGALRKSYLLLEIVLTERSSVKNSSSASQANSSLPLLSSHSGIKYLQDSHSCKPFPSMVELNLTHWLEIYGSRFPFLFCFFSPVPSFIRLIPMLV